MLGAKRVRIHGMKDNRWTIKDKLTQYKGLVNLYARDRLIIEHDTHLQARKQKQTLRKLRKDIKAQRRSLDNAINGDRQRLRNTLADHRNIQLAYQDLPPERVTDHIHQDNFNKRKELDRLHYKVRQKEQQLESMILEIAALEDRLRYQAPGMIPIERQAQIITGKVQDAILKKEAAISVRNTYRAILQIMQKDEIYFDPVLAALQVDGYNQGRCMFRTTELGQIATEYLDDRKQEYKNLQKIIRKNMAERQKSIDFVRDQVAYLSSNLKHLIRRDSDVNILKREENTSPIEQAMAEELESLEETLNFLQTAMMVSLYSQIFPCLEEQLRQKERLEELVMRYENNRDILLNKANHAKLMRDRLCYTMLETTKEYKSEKNRLLQSVNEEEEKHRKLNNATEKRGKVLTFIRAALQQLAEMLRNVKTEDEDMKKLGDPDIILPDKVEEDALKLLNLLAIRLSILDRIGLEGIEERKKNDAVVLYQRLIVDSTSKSQVEEFESFDEAMLEVQMEDSKVPTRAEIKQRSREIVEKYKKPEIEVIQIKRRPRKKKWM